MKKIRTLAVVLGALFMVVGCGKSGGDTPGEIIPPPTNTYTVQFNTHGGSAVETLTDVYKIQTSPVTTKLGATFEGWYESEAYTFKLRFPYVVTRNITLHAKWDGETPIEGYTVQFNTHGGSAVATMQNITSITSSPITTRSGYEFEGWYVSESFVPANKVSFPYTVTENITLHANWTAIPPATYTVQFDTHGGSSVATMQNVTVIESSPVTIRSGYDFEGWYTSDSFAPASKVSFPYQVTQNITLHANWTALPPETFTVQFNTHGGSPVATMENITVINEAPVSTRSGYMLEGWYKSDAFNPGDKVTFPYQVTQNMTLHANWVELPPETYTVQFNTHGGSAVATMENVTLIETSPVTTRSGFDFEGWYKSDAYNPSDKVSFPLLVTQNLTLHANWTEIPQTYTVQFNTHGGSPVATMEGVSVINEEPVSTRSGYSLEGWYTSDEFIPANKVSFPYAVTQNITLHANWNLITYTVHFNSNGGTSVSDAVDVVSIAESPVTTRTGYDFLGWFTSESETTPVSFPYAVDHNQTLVAKWDRDRSVTLLNGEADEDYWTSEVLSGQYVLKLNDDYKTEVMGLKVEGGIRLFVQQHVKVQKNSGNNWWQRDNIEFRFGSALDHVRPMNAQPQKWASVLDSGSSNFGQIGISNFVYNEVTGLYDVNYEMYATFAEIGVNSYDQIIFAAGVSYNGDAWKCLDDWDSGTQDLFLMKAITSTGIKDFTYDYYDDTASSFLPEPIHGEWDKDPAHNWNSNVFNAHMDGSSSWAIVLEMESVTDSSKVSEDIAAGIVGEVYSPGWANGGWTFRKDWYGWGAWPEQKGSIYDYNYKEICAHSTDGDDWRDRVEPILKNAMSDMTVKAYVSFNSAIKQITVNMVYTCGASTDYAGKHIWLSFQAGVGDYNGEMIVAFGYNFSSFTINSAKLITGNIL